MDSAYPANSLSFVSSEICIGEYFGFAHFVETNILQRIEQAPCAMTDLMMMEQIAHLMNVDAAICQEMDEKCSTNLLDSGDDLPNANEEEATKRKIDWKEIYT